jgi:hypothetical protein
MLVGQTRAKRSDATTSAGSTGRTERSSISSSRNEEDPRRSTLKSELDESFEVLRESSLIAKFKKKSKKKFSLISEYQKNLSGWDEALLTMQAGEVAAVTIEPEWAYGKKGQPEAGIGPNQTLWFEITLDRIGGN